MLNYLKKIPIAQRLKNTWLGRLAIRSAGDWKYPFMLASWGLASILVPRRKISIEGISFTLSCTNWVTHFRWFLFKSKEPEVRYYIDKYVRDGDIFFDIGANVGVFSIYAAIRYPNISVYCFEPEYSNLNALKENIVCNKLMHRANIYSVAISNFIGFSKLHLQDITTGSAAHSESRKPINLTHEGYPVVWTEGIVSVTLDYLCEQLGVIPNAIKIDTDGNEDKVLEGAVKTLSNSNLRSLVIEMPHENKDKSDLCYEILKSAGLYLAWSNKERTRNEIWIRQ